MVMKISIALFFFKVKAYKRTRRHDLTLAKEKDVRKYSVSHRTVNEWNKLIVYLDSQKPRASLSSASKGVAWIRLKSC